MHALEQHAKAHKGQFESIVAPFTNSIIVIVTYWITLLYFDLKESVMRENGDLIYFSFK